MAGLTEGSQGRQRSKTAVTRCRTVAPAVAGTRQRVFQMISVAGNLVIRFFRRDYQETGCLSRLPGDHWWSLEHSPATVPSLEKASLKQMTRQRARQSP